jgi:hypothetical protein
LGSLLLIHKSNVLKINVDTLSNDSMCFHLCKMDEFT